MHKKVTLYVEWLQNDTGIWEYSELLWIGDIIQIQMSYIFFLVSYKCHIWTQTYREGITFQYVLVIWDLHIISTYNY